MSDKYHRLYHLWRTSRVSDAEIGELWKWLAKQSDEEIEALVLQGWEQCSELSRLTEAQQIKIADWILTRYPKDITSDEKPMRTVYRIPFFRRWSWAAAVIILLGAATITVVVSSDRQQTPSKKDVVLSTASDILPGTNKAVLTVDNKQIDLASDKTSITVGKTIAYTDGEKLFDAGQQLILTTPNGGQYQLVLPDGTKAWLNAASSIRFPSVFKDGKRQIKITGEVYLEVAKDKSKPFFVDVDGHSTVQVLGTSFNVNSYADEVSIKTTLIDGSIRILPLQATAVVASSDQQPGGQTAGLGDSKSAVTLKPGQQAIQPLSDSKTITLNSNADLSQILAWKNGLFNFNNSSLRSAMKQLEKWYDIKVRYEGKEPDIDLKGEIYRNVRLSTVLEFLKKSGIDIRMEGKTLIVL